jgi:RNA polymerase sigma factor (sigma-70 family)
MDAVLKLAKTYRLTTGLADRLQLAEELFAYVEPELRLFVFTSVASPVAEDVLQEVLHAVATRLDTFAGNSAGEFWAWAYTITRRRVADEFRRQGSDRLQPLPPDDLWRLVDESAKAEPLSAADRHDLDYALSLLAAAKPDCQDYLWRHYVLGLDYGEIAAEQGVSYDSARMRVSRCLEEAQALIA